VTALAIAAMGVAGSIATWLWTTARWRGYIEEQETRWQEANGQLLRELGSLQDATERANTRATHTTERTADWAEGYKLGCTDMIRAMAALRGHDARES
jgi:hypothetical protein